MRGPDGHIDAGNFVLGLDHGQLELRPFRFQVDALVGGRADGVIGLKPQPGLDLGNADGLDALDQNARLPLLCGERRQPARGPLLEMGAHVVPRRLHRQHVHLGRLRLATLEAFADRLKQEVFLVTDQSHGGTQRDGVPHHDVLP